MKSNFTPGTGKGTGRGPLITLKEAASEFGVSTISVVQMMSNDPNKPKPAFSINTASAGYRKVNWYNPKEIRAWLSEKLGREAKA